MGLLFIFLDPPTLVSTPVLTTDGSTGITQTGATLQGSIVQVGGELNVERGFQINTTPYPSTAPDGEVSETGSFNKGSYSLNVSGLTPGQIYFYRAFSRNTQYEGYGEWLSFQTLPAVYNVEINGVDRTSDIILPSLNVDDIINDEPNACTFILDNRSGNGIPSPDQEVIITLNDETKLFGGTIVNVSYGSKMANGVVMVSIQCVDYTRLLDSNLVHKTYENMTDAAIIADIVSTYCPGFGITTTNVSAGATVEQISFNYLQPSQCIRRLAELTGRHWYIDYDKDIHYFPLETDTTPFDIDSSQNGYFNLQLSKDASQIKNRVYVRGGTKLSDFTTYTEVGDGEKRKFVLPDKPYDVTVEVDRGAGYVEESVGIKNIDSSGYKWYLNYQEKYLEQDDAETVLGATDIIKVTYKYDIPILVAVENTASIIEHGQKEFAIFDKNIRTSQAARDRASAELIDYASNIIEGTFETYEHGFRSGQYISVNLSDYGVNENYLVQKVSAMSMGAGLYKYTVSIASVKTMGIIKFLIKLLEENKNSIELDDNEVVDELLTIADSLLSDSLTDSLTIDSAGPYATWCVDSLETTPTRAVWGLFQWG